MSKNATIVAQIAALTAKIEEQAALINALKSAAPVVRKPSDWKIVIVRDVPSKSGGTHRTIEVYNNATGERIVNAFLDSDTDQGTRSDGGKQRVLYASNRSAQGDAKPAAPAPAKSVPASVDF